MSDVPDGFHDDGSEEELYKILGKSEVGNQHVIAGALFEYQIYRPYCHGGLPVFIIGNHAQRNPAVLGDVLSAMVMGVIEGPVEGVGIALGDTVYAAWDGTDPYLTTDASDSNVVCCWGIIIDDQRPIGYGEAVLVGTHENLWSIRMVGPSCSSIAGDS